MGVIGTAHLELQDGISLRRQDLLADDFWFVDPDAEEILIDRRRKKRYVTTTITRGKVESTALPGFWIKAEWLWADPLPKVLSCVRQILGE